MSQGEGKGGRYRSRRQLAARPSADATGADPFARTALDPPRFTDAKIRELASAEVRSAPVPTAPEAASSGLAPLPNSTPPRPMWSTRRWFVALCAATIASAAGAVFGFWLAGGAV